MPSITQIQMLPLISRYACGGGGYYEGIAFNGDFNQIISHDSCSWGTGKKLTLTEVSEKNPGLCIGTPSPSH